MKKFEETKTKIEFQNFCDFLKFFRRFFFNSKNLNAIFILNFFVFLRKKRKFMKFFDFFYLKNFFS